MSSNLGSEKFSQEKYVSCLLKLIKTDLKANNVQHISFSNFHGVPYHFLHSSST